MTTTKDTDNLQFANDEMARTQNRITRQAATVQREMDKLATLYTELGEDRLYYRQAHTAAFGGTE